MGIPLACRLEEAEARRQGDAWRALLDQHAVGTKRVSPTEVAIHLGDDPDGLAAVVGLAQREKACCPFFDFGLEIEADRVTLHVSAPEEAASLLDLFVPPPPGPGLVVTN
jgi:hypothetical protein